MFVKRNTVDGVVKVSFQKIADEFGITRGKVRHIIDKFYSENLLTRTTSAQSSLKVGATFAQASTENQEVADSFRTTSAQSSLKVGATFAQSNTKVADIEVRKHSFGEKLIPYMKQYGKDMIRQFFDYWTEINEGGSKMRLEKEKTFEIAKRLARWHKNNIEKKSNVSKYSSLPVGMNLQNSNDDERYKLDSRWNK